MREAAHLEPPPAPVWHLKVDAQPLCRVRLAVAEAAVDGNRPASSEAQAEQEKCSGTILSHLLDISETDIWAEEELGEIKVEHVSSGGAHSGASQNSERGTTYTVYSFGDIT